MDVFLSSTHGWKKATCYSCGQEAKFENESSNAWPASVFKTSKTGEDNHERTMEIDNPCESPTMAPACCQETTQDRTLTNYLFLNQRGHSGDPLPNANHMPHMELKKLLLCLNATFLFRRSGGCWVLWLSLKRDLHHGKRRESVQLFTTYTAGDISFRWSVAHTSIYILQTVFCAF